jgi:nitrogen fixation NifU-like protein
MTASAVTSDLYRRVVLDHSRQPRNQGRPARFDRQAEGNNRLCGDRITVYATVDEGRLEAVHFEATGCAICIASASLMTTALEARSVGETRAAIDAVSNAFAGDGALPEAVAALGGVRDYPARIRCATLPWMTLKAALDADTDPVSTE